MTKVAAVIRADNAKEAERQSRMALEKGADLVELRLDYVRELGSLTIRKLANDVGRRAIATFRSRGQGGASGVDPAQRTTVLREIRHTRSANGRSPGEQSCVEQDPRPMRPAGPARFAIRASRMSTSSSKRTAKTLGRL